LLWHGITPQQLIEYEVCLILRAFVIIQAVSEGDCNSSSDQECSQF
jgi:hypothetical protein